jgi:hypothetical protein
MDYYKVKKCIREYLENNNERISDRAEARVIRMSQKGYLAMMEHHTLTVKKLEEIAQKFNKPVSYFFVNEDKIYKLPEIEPDVANENNDCCRLCKEKDDHIKSLKKTIEILENSGKKESHDESGASSGEDTKRNKAV